MTKRLRNFLAGAGSILQIMPPPMPISLDRLRGPARKRPLTPREAIAADMRMVGLSMRAAMGKVERERKRTPTSAQPGRPARR